jgi:hypothetical protein
MTRLFLLCIAFGFFFAHPVSSQRSQLPKTTTDTEIQRMIKEISAKRIEASIRKLVSFGTRNTL